MNAISKDDTDAVQKPAIGRGGARPNSGRKTKGEQADHYTRLAKARADHEEEKARLAELERMQLEGELIPASEVEKRFIDAASRVKSRLMSVPGRVAPSVVAITDIIEADAVIKSAIAEALKELRL